MSLVAYGSSDESDQSDVDEKANENIFIADKKLTPIASEVIDKSSDAEIEEKISDSDSDNDNRTTLTQSSHGIDSKLKELPTPKSVSSGQIVETDELEDEVKPKPSQVADVEKPAPRKLRQTVKITIPALPDSDDDEPAKKKPRPSYGNGGSGLTSLLPAPVHAAKKEAGRILIPYALAKKAQSSSTGVPKKTGSSSTTSQTADKSKKISASLADYGSDSSDDDETGNSGNFFSLDTSKNRSDCINNLDSTVKSTPEQMVGPSLPSEKFDRLQSNLDTSIPTVPLPPSFGRTSLNLPAPANSDNSVTNDNSLSGLSGESSSDGTDVAKGPALDPDAPLTFKGGVTSQRRYSNHNSYVVSSSSSSSSSSSTGLGINDPNAARDQNMYYNMRYENMQYPESTDVDGFQQDNEFLKLQGKKQRGKEEINLIDVNADDFTDPSEITKHLTEEQTYQSHKSKDNQPTGQQKKKHQIQYLAFQAKERELELKNQWSQNRQTKKQTQAKYGF